MDANTDFIDKWRARWPEWRVAEAFIPSNERASVLACFTLTQELTDAAWGGSDPLPGRAKLAWWAEELEGWAHGRRRHPLGFGFSRQALAWPMLAASLPALIASRAPVENLEHAILALESFAQAVANITTALHDVALPSSARNIALGLLAQRLLVYGDDAVPLQSRVAILQRANKNVNASTVPLAWAVDLLRAWPSSLEGGRATRIHAALLRERLQAYADGAAPSVALPHWRTLTTAWRAARA